MPRDYSRSARCNRTLVKYRILVVLARDDFTHAGRESEAIFTFSRRIGNLRELFVEHLNFTITGVMKVFYNFCLNRGRKLIEARQLIWCVKYELGRTRKSAVFHPAGEMERCGPARCFREAWNSSRKKSSRASSVRFGNRTWPWKFRCSLWQSDVKRERRIAGENIRRANWRQSVRHRRARRPAFTSKWHAFRDC